MQPSGVSVEQCCVESVFGDYWVYCAYVGFRRTVLCGKIVEDRSGVSISMSFRRTVLCGKRRLKKEV